MEQQEGSAGSQNAALHVMPSASARPANRPVEETRPFGNSDTMPWVADVLNVAEPEIDDVLNVEDVLNKHDADEADMDRV